MNHSFRKVCFGQFKTFTRLDSDFLDKDEKQNSIEISYFWSYPTFGLTEGQVIKGQIKTEKQDWRAVDSPKKRTNKFVLSAFLLFTANKLNSFVRFLGESTARQSCFWFYLTFSKLCFEIPWTIVFSFLTSKIIVYLCTEWFVCR